MSEPRDTKRAMLQLFLAALAYRTQKALRDAPATLVSFQPGPQELVRHMTSVLGCARTLFIGGMYRAHSLDTLETEVARFHTMLEELAVHLSTDAPLRGITEEQLLQGPLAYAMTHAGQLALLRRLAGAPVPPENFIFAAIRADRLGPDQADLANPDPDWPEWPV